MSNILEVLKREMQVAEFTLEQDRIHVSNGTLLLDGLLHAENIPILEGIRWLLFDSLKTRVSA